MADGAIHHPMLGTDLGVARTLPGSYATAPGVDTSTDVGAMFYRYDAELDAVGSLDGAGVHSTMTYDRPADGNLSAGTGKLSSTEDVRGRRRMVYNSAGQTVVEYDYAQNGVSRTFDRVGRVVEEQSRVAVGTDLNLTPTEQSVFRTYTYNDPGVVIFSDRNGDDTTVTTNYAAGTVTTETDDYTKVARLGGDGSPRLLHDTSSPINPGDNFGAGHSLVAYARDAVGRVTAETTIVSQNGVTTPSVRVTTTYAGPDPATRTIATAPAGTDAGYQTVLTETFDVDDLGRVQSMDVDLIAAASRWSSGTTPSDHAVDAVFAADGRLDSLSHRVAGVSTPAVTSDYDYRGDGRITSVTHRRGGTIGDMIATHSTDRTADGRHLSAAAEVFTRGGVSMASASATFGHDSRRNIVSAVYASSTTDEDLLAGFRTVSPDTEVTDGADLAAGRRLLQSGDRRFRYDAEGRLIKTLDDGTFSDDLEELAYDVAGRLRNVTRTNDPVVGSDTVSATAFAYDAAGRRVATRVVDDSGVPVTTGAYGDAGLAELTFDASGAVTGHVATLPGVSAPVALSGADATGQTVLLLPDYAGAIRTYAAFDGAGNPTAYRHQNSDGHGVPTSQLDNDNGRFDAVDLPVIFAGRGYESSTGSYHLGGGLGYDAGLGRRLSPNVSSSLDDYTLSTGHANVRVAQRDSAPSPGTPSYLVGTHLALEAVGLLPGIGIMADLINAGLYGLEGDYVNASLSVGAAIPLIGYAANAARVGRAAGTAADITVDVTRLYRASRAADLTHNFIESVYNVYSGVQTLQRDGDSLVGRVQIAAGLFGVSVNTAAATGVTERIVRTTAEPSRRAKAAVSRAAIPPKQLTHLTSEEAYLQIMGVGPTAGKIGSQWGIFALESGKVPRSLFWRSFNTLVAERQGFRLQANLTHLIEIPSEAVGHFGRPLPMGPFSAYRRWVAGVHSTPLGSIEIHSGAFIRGEILQHGVFRQAKLAERMRYYGHQFTLDYGVDAGLYGIAALGTVVYVGEQGIIDAYNWLRGDDR